MAVLPPRSLALFMPTQTSTLSIVMRIAVEEKFCETNYSAFRLETGIKSKLIEAT